MRWSNGTLPVVVSCPHGGMRPIEGVEPRTKPVPGFCCVRDSYTLDVALGVAEGLEHNLGQGPNVVVADFARKFCDVNRPRNLAYERRAASPCWTTYHGQICRAVKKVKHGLLVDVHGTSRSEADVFVGTALGTSLFSWEPLEIFWTTLTNHGYVLSLDAARLSGGWTVQRWGATLGGLDALQLELSWPLRQDETLRSVLTHHLVEALSQTVTKCWLGGCGVNPPPQPLPLMPSQTCVV